MNKLHGRGRSVVVARRVPVDAVARPGKCTFPRWVRGLPLVRPPSVTAPFPLLESRPRSRESFPESGAPPEAPYTTAARTETMPSSRSPLGRPAAKALAPSRNSRRSVVVRPPPSAPGPLLYRGPVRHRLGDRPGGTSVHRNISREYISINIKSYSTENGESTLFYSVLTNMKNFLLFMK